MSGTLTQKALRRSMAQIKYVTPVPPAAARGLVAHVYSQAERDFGMLAPPVALHSPAPGPLAACWLMLRETLLAPGAASRAAKESVAAAVSSANSCPYCVTVHGAAVGGLVSPKAAAIASDHTQPADLADITSWVLAGAAGRPPSGATCPVAGQEFAELAGVAVTFHYLNRMVNIFLAESPLPPGTPRRLSGGLMRILAKIMLSSRPGPGESLTLLPAAPLPNDLAWADAAPNVASAVSRATAVIDAEGARTVPDSVCDLLSRTLARWDGKPPGLSRAWVSQAVSGVPATDRPAATLALLTALASYQISSSDIEDFRRDHADDQVLIALTAWASMTAARTAASWLTAVHPVPS